MFDNYIVKNETLYIDLNINYEFGNFKNTKTNLKKELKKFLNSLKINFNKMFRNITPVTKNIIILNVLVYIASNLLLNGKLYSDECGLEISSEGGEGFFA